MSDLSRPTPRCWNRVRPTRMHPLSAAAVIVGIAAKRFTTYERVERLPLFVIKNDGSRELFKYDKLLVGRHSEVDQERPASVRRRAEILAQKD